MESRHLKKFLTDSYKAYLELLSSEGASEDPSSLMSVPQSEAPIVSMLSDGEDLTGPITVVDIAVTSVPEVPKKLATPKAKPTPLTIGFGLEFTGSLEIPGDTIPLRTLSSNEITPTPITIEVAGVGNGVTEELFSDSLLSAFVTEFGFDPFRLEGSFTTTTDGAYKINKTNFKKLIEDGSVKSQLIEELKELIPVPSQATQLLSAFTLQFEAEDTSILHSLNLNQLLADPVLVETFEEEYDYEDVTKVVTIEGTLSEVILWVMWYDT
jgi:hypothetical protein